MNPKAKLKSRVLLANTIGIAVALYQHFAGPILPVDPNVWMLVLGTVNFGLRFLTTRPLAI